MIGYVEVFIMMEVEHLKQRIIDSGHIGIETAIIRDDYAPAGDMMMRMLMDSGEFVQRKVPAHCWEQKWKIFSVEHDPYK